MVKFILNEQIIETNMQPGTILLDFIREQQGLKGTKEACREGECGACTVLIGRLENGVITYKNCASCITPLGDINNCHIVTIEGVNMESPNLIQSLIIKHGAAQCGFCTPGIVISLTGFCLNSSDFSYEDAENSIDGNLCRCTGYASIKRVVKELSDLLISKEKDKKERINFLIDESVIPDYFRKIPVRLKNISEISVPLKENNVIVAGGTDLFVQRPDELENENLFFLSSQAGLNYIKEDKDNILIGGAVVVEDCRNSEIMNKYFSDFKKILLRHSSAILRNRATLSGNIVNASPIGDMTIILLALGTILIIENSNGAVREIGLSNFYKGYKKYDLAKSEIIKELRIPRPRGSYFFNFEKVSNRKTLDIAAVNSALMLYSDNAGKILDLQISAGGVAPIPYLAKEMSQFKGQRPDKKIIAEKIIEQVSPIDDVRGSAEYKKLLLKQLIISHFNAMEE